MEALWDIISFTGKALVFFVTFAACIGLFFARVRGRRRHQEPHVFLREVSKRWHESAVSLKHALGNPKKGRFGRAAKPPKEEPSTLTKRVFVIDFKGDIMATGVESLREEVTAVVGIAEATDEVVVRLESPGGAVHSYGLAASQLARLREKNIPLTICVDKVAASGGYMMACVGQQVIAAPFAVIGSIGVVASLPNVHRLLEKHGVDYADYTAGRYKRTVTVLGQVTDEGKAKLKEQLEETHGLFKEFIHTMRPKLDVEAVATGEHWYGTRAVELGLIDKLSTSDDYLLERAKEARVFEVECERPRPLRERAASMAYAIVTRLASPH
jgi:serine protease SohB